MYGISIGAITGTSLNSSSQYLLNLCVLLFVSQWQHHSSSSIIAIDFSQVYFSVNLKQGSDLSIDHNGSVYGFLTDLPPVDQKICIFRPLYRLMTLNKKPNKFFLFTFNFRPKFLQYRYMYDYRTNYYNDVIDYLDKRAKGEACDVPRAQTWAERVLRTHTK